LQSLATTPIFLDFLAGCIGLFVGSFLNLWALRSLNSQSVFRPANASFACEHRFNLSEFIPLCSHLLRKGKCRHCKGLIPWYFPAIEIFTAGSFIVILHHFGWTIYGLAMLLFVSVLITICITDFKEKIIPHEITYPAIILGIIFSATVRQDFMGTLAGIGISYIFFDFVAFYGLKVYLFYNQPQLVIESHHKISALPPRQNQPNLANLVVRILPNGLSMAPPVDLIKRKGKLFGRKNFILPGGQSAEDFEVMGGGDAVLAALISAWLGLPKLLLALTISFIAGTALGAGYLLVEMHKQKLLGSLLRPIIFSAAVGAISLIGVSMILSHLLQQSLTSLHWLSISFVGAMVGGVIGIIHTGSHVSKPFPFGPALALGALIAMC
jgi:prepilin signal peptidase PulO-like enzyme (type II secretory pathway)